MGRKKVIITGKNGFRLCSIRGTFGTELAEEMAKEVKMNLTPQEKELWFDHTFLIPQYRVSELIKGCCVPQNCHKCNIGSGRGGSFINSECMEEFFEFEKGGKNDNRNY